MTYFGIIIGCIIGLILGHTVQNFAIIFPIAGGFLGHYISEYIEEYRVEERKARAESEQRRREEEYARQRKIQRRLEAIQLAKKYPKATRHYFKQHWGIVKSSISDYDITDEKVDTLLSHKSSYESDEFRLNFGFINSVFRTQKATATIEQQLKEAKKREAERQAILEKQRAEEQAKQKLLNSTKGWNLLAGSLHYTYLLRYYPTTCGFEATMSEWADRWTVWNFKNTPGRTSSSDHQKALNTVIPQIKSKLINTFGCEALKYLTLVCIPGSSSEKTRARYEEFSNRLCSETGMANSYGKIRVVSSSSEKKKGGEGITASNVSLDSSYFNGRYVLLFDDVITKGESMLRFKKMMEEYGATVVGGFSIGKTSHSRIE